MKSALLASTVGLLQLGTCVAGLPFTEWTFETSVPFQGNSATLGPLAPEVGAGSAYGVHSLATTDWSNPPGNGSAESWSATRWSPGDYFEFRTSTASLAGIASGVEISWDQSSSSTGPKSFALSYSTDGSSFTSLMSYSVLVSTAVTAPDPQARSAWSTAGTRQSIYSFTPDPTSLPSGLVGQADVYFRLTDTEAAVSAAGGTSRVDNFAVNYTPFAPVPEPEEYALLFAASLVGFGLIRRMGRN